MTQKNVPIKSTELVTTALAVSASVTADAVGTDTFVDTTMAIKVVGRGLMSYAVGSVTGIAVASSQEGEIEYASAAVDLDVTGAEILVVNKHETIGSGDMSSSTASLDFLAIDVAWSRCKEVIDSEDVDIIEVEGTISGNVATFAADLVAEGMNTFTDLAVDAFTVDDQMSSSVMVGTAAVSAQTLFHTVIGTRASDTIITTDNSTIVESGSGNDTIVAKGGDDWIFAGSGNDKVSSGSGDDTVYGDSGNDLISAGDGNDWVFAGRGNDTLLGGNGHDLLLGEEGRDCIDGGDGNDLIDGGDDNDQMSGGKGNDIFRLGDTRGDGNDVYFGGAGADLYLISGDFERDVIADFRLAEGDRLFVPNGDWESDAALSYLNGCALFLSRSACEPADLVITFAQNCETSSLTLYNFFNLNSDFSRSAPMGQTLSDAQALPFLRALFGDDYDVYASAPVELFDVADYLGELG